MTNLPKTVEDWSKRASESGLSGGVTVISDINGDRSIKDTKIGSGGAAEFQTKIPHDLLPHIHEILRERDRMVAAAMKASIEVPHEQLREMHLTSMKASCLLIAIDVIRKKYPAPFLDGGAKTIEDVSLIPDDMQEHAKLIFEVRDRLWDSAGNWWGKETPEFSAYQRIERENPNWPRGKIMNAVLLPIAIENTRLVKGKTNDTGTASPEAQGPTADQAPSTAS